MLRTLIFLISLSSEAVELRLLNGYPVVHANVNGKGPFQLLVDTGSSSCVLTSKAALAAGLQYTSRTILISSGLEQVVPVAASNVIQVGSFKQANVELLKVERFGAAAMDTSIDGILGQSFLNTTPVLLDYKSRQMLLGEEARRHASELGPPLQARLSDGRLAVEVKADRQTMQLVVDSGASHLTMTCDGGCRRGTRRLEPGVVLTSAGRRYVERVQVEEIRVGGVSFRDQVAILMPPAAKDSASQGLLPARWFDAVYLDYHGGEVRLRLS